MRLSKLSTATVLSASALVVFSLALPFTAHAKIYKCSTANGKTAFQATPCKANQKSQEVKVRGTKLKPTRNVTEADLKMLNYYTAYIKVKPAIKACTRRKTPSASALQTAYANYQAVNIKNIKAGKVLFNQGFLDKSSSELKQQAKRVQRSQKDIMERLDDAGLENLCKQQARQLEFATERVKNGTEGYKPGELDPIAKRS